MAFQHILIETGVQILERNLSKQLKRFRFVILPNSAGSALTIDKDYSIFSKSASHLARLAAFLHAAFKNCQQANLPIVLAALNQADDTYLVVGSVALSRGGQVKKKFVSSYSAHSD